MVDLKNANKNNGKKEKIALFYSASDWAWDDEFYEIGCPGEYSFPGFEQRKAMAQWFMTEGMKYFNNKKDGVLYFVYRGDWHHTVAVIDLDISRPWKFTHSDDPEWPWERILYLDHLDAHNRVIPEMYPPKRWE